jgi:hypothetical protein
MNAHVAIFNKDRKWCFSHFLDDFKDLNWRVGFSYISNPSPQNDICWAKIPGGDPDALDLETSEIKDPVKAQVIFRQPFNMNGEWIGSQATLGSTEAVLFPTQSHALIEGEGQFAVTLTDHLLEAIDIGFRGMSGAMAVSEAGKCLGMFVKRGSPIPFKNRRRPFVGRKYNSIQRFFREFVGLDEIQEYLTDKVLTVDDMHELAVVFDARRGIFLPSSAISSIDDDNSAEIRRIIGFDAPDIPPF